MKKIIFKKGIFVAVGSGIYTSSDGMNWTERSSDNMLMDISYGNDTIVAVGRYGTIIQSDPLGSFYAGTDQ